MKIAFFDSKPYDEEVFSGFSTDNLSTNFVLNTFLSMIPLLIIDFIKIFVAAFLTIKLKKIGDTAIK